MQDSVECAGPQKYNGKSPVFIHWMVLEIQTLFRMSSTKCDASTKHDALIHVRDQEEQPYLELPKTHRELLWKSNMERSPKIYTIF